MTSDLPIRFINAAHAISRCPLFGIAGRRLRVRCKIQRDVRLLYPALFTRQQ